METTHQSTVILRCKVVIVGDACIGKSALTQVFTSGGSTYPKSYLMTIGAEFNVKQVLIPDTNYVVELFLYDCAGQSIFNQLDMSAKYYEDAAVIVCAYSIASKESFQSVNKWYTAMKASLTGANQNPIGVLVGCKSDLRDGTVDSRGEVSTMEGQALASSLGMGFFETSAASNMGVEDVFRFIAEQFHKKYEEIAHTMGH
jgi:transport family protein 27